MAKKRIAKQFKPHEYKWDFDATSLTQETTPLCPVGRTTPVVWYSQIAWMKIQYLVQSANKEVGWFGLVETYEEGYLIEDVYVPKQTVTGAETDITPEDLTAFFLDLDAEGIDTSRLFYWGHSHVNMGVGPSGQDEEQIDEYLENNPIFIRGIYNKLGQAKVDIFDTNAGVVYQCVPNSLDIADDVVTEIDLLLEQNVSERTFLPGKIITPQRAIPGSYVNNYGMTHNELWEGLDDEI